MSRDNVNSSDSSQASSPSGVWRLLTTASRTRWLGALVAVEAVLAGAVIREVGRISDVSAGAGILDAEIGYSRAEVVALFDSYGRQGRSFYRNLQLWDLAHPLIYSLLLAALLFRVFRDSRYSWVALFPFVIGALDYLENAFLWAMISTYPDINNVVASVANALSIAKFMSYLPTLVAAGVAAWIAARRRFRQQP